MTAKEQAEQIKQLLREYLASDDYGDLPTATTTCENLRKHYQGFLGDRVRVEVTLGWEENTFDVAVYALHSVEYVSVEFTIEGKDEVSSPIEEQQS